MVEVGTLWRSQAGQDWLRVQAKFVRFESARASPLQAYPPFGLNPGDMTGTQDIDRGLLITRAFGPFVGQKVLNLQLSHGIPTLCQWEWTG